MRWALQIDDTTVKQNLRVEFCFNGVVTIHRIHTHTQGQLILKGNCCPFVPVMHPRKGMCVWGEEGRAAVVLATQARNKLYSWKINKLRPRCSWRVSVAELMTLVWDTNSAEINYLCFGLCKFFKWTSSKVWKVRCIICYRLLITCLKAVISHRIERESLEFIFHYAASVIHRVSLHDNNYINLTTF